MSDQVALHYTNSTLRERIVEHVFVGEALRALWRRGIVDVEVLRAEFDAHGYDLVMSRGKVTRHIQFKTGTRPKPLRKVIIARAMEAKPSGCVLWISISQDLDLLSFWWFGGEPGDKIPPLSGFANARRIGRQASGNRPERSAQCSIPPSRFRCLTSVDEVLETLFGPLPRMIAPVVAEDEAEETGS